MTTDQTADLAYSLLFLVLVASSLLARRLPLGQAAKYALAWVAIFGSAIVLYSFRHVAGQVLEQVKHELNPDAPVQSGSAVRIRKADDGHFHVIASVNGHDLRFLIDSGATTTALSRAGAAAADVPIDEMGFPEAVETANGMAMMRRTQIERLEIGGILRINHPVLVGDDIGELNVLGMNFLSSLDIWKVEGNEMILTP